MKQFEKEAMDKLVKFLKTKYGIRILKQRAKLWNSKLKIQLPGIPLHPDIDLLSYNEKTKELIGMEAKVIYLTDDGKLNRRYYDGLDQAIALQMFGFDKVYFIQFFLAPHKPEEGRDKILKCFVDYSQNIMRIIKYSNLSIGYTPFCDYLLESRLTKDTIKVLDIRKSSGLQLPLKPKRNPVLNSNLDHVKKIREYLLNNYVKKKC